MVASITFLAVLLACALLFFVVPHHPRKAETFKPCTMGAVYADFFQELPRIYKPEMQVMVLLGLAGLVASFYPALLVAMVRWVRPEAFWFVVIGVIAVIGVAANFLGMLISHLNFGWGVSSADKVTPF